MFVKQLKKNYKLVHRSPAKCGTSLVINGNFSHICYRFRDRKLLILPTPPLFDAPARGTP